MRLLYTLFTLAAGGYGLFWIADKNPELKAKCEEIIDFRKTRALEMRYDAASVMELHQSSLLKERGMRFLSPELKFYPHLLMEIKYSTLDHRTKEGWILWDLTDGEMIIDTKTWEKSHGFADCILTSCQRHEFKLLQALETNVVASISSLAETLQVETPYLEIVLSGCQKKNLILPTADGPRLHLENPKLTINPETRLPETLTTRQHKHAERVGAHFTRGQVERIAKVAFGEGFSIRTSEEIYLPVHRLTIQHPEGAQKTVHFNALTGKPVPPTRFYR